MLDRRDKVLANELLQQKAAAIKRNLERWAKRNKVLKPGECIVFLLDIRQTETVIQEGQSFLETSVEEFFTTERLVSLGVPRKVYSERVKNCITNANNKWAGTGKDGQFVQVAHSVREFFENFPNKRSLSKIRNLGGSSLQHFVAAMAKMGVEIPD